MVTKHNIVDNGKFLWIKQVSIKVNSLNWRAKMGRIPLDVETFQNTCGFQYCCQCESYASYVETSDHVLVQCQFAKTVT